MSTPIVGLVGVYHADGGLIGEVRYLVGKMLGTTHCGLCDVTFSGVRPKRSWGALVAGLGVDFRLLHLNELAADEASVVATAGSPVVLARTAEGELARVLGRPDLDALGGSVEKFDRALRQSLDVLGLALPGEECAGERGSAH